MLPSRDANTSSSLQIIEPQNRMTFSSSNSGNSFDISHDRELSYSHDESSLSFHIEGDRNSGIREAVFGNQMLTNQPPKRNRKEIFSKYKVNGDAQGNGKGEGGLPIADNQIMRAFDEIFSISTPRSLSQGEIQAPKFVGKKIYVQPQMPNNLQMLKPDRRPVSDQAQFARGTPEKVNRMTTRDTEGSNKSPELYKSNQFFKTPLELSSQKAKETNFNKSNLSHLSEIEYRLSAIEGRENDISRDSSDFAQILKAQIFNSNIRSSQPEAPTMIPTSDLKQSPTKSTQGQFQKVPARIPSVQLSNSNVNSNTVVPQSIKQSEQSMKESRFSDVYQRIDMSQSVANSILIRNPRMQIFGNNGNGSLGSLGNIDSSGGSRMFLKSGSFGNLISQEEETLINALGSAKLIQEAAEEKRIPVFLRKAAKLNSMFPNFGHPLIQTNIEQENVKLQELVQKFSEALYFVEKMLQKIRSKEQKRKQVVSLFSNGITLQKFKTSDWESCIRFSHLEDLRPRQNLLARQWNDMKVEKALENYRKIIEQHRGIRLKLQDERGIAKYFQIRRKYWDIQKNLISITNDMYTRIMCLGFPKHFVQFKKIMEEEEILFSWDEIREKKVQLQHFRLLRNKNDELCASEVGSFVINKLVNQIRFNSATS